MKTLAFVATVMLLFNLILVHAVNRIRVEQEERIDQLDRTVNSLIEIHYKGDYDECRAND